MNTLHIGKLTGLIILILICVVLLVIVLRKIFIRQKTKNELRQATEKHMREESLDHMILNQYNMQTERNKAYNPYEVSYEKRTTGQVQNVSGRVMVSLEEKNELSTKKFVLNPAKVIRIGSGLKENDVIVQGEGIAECQCEIFSDNNKVFVRNKNSGSPTVLQRKREHVLVDDRGLRILTGDVILVGKVAYRVTLIGT